MERSGGGGKKARLRGVLHSWRAEFFHWQCLGGEIEILFIIKNYCISKKTTIRLYI